MRLTDPERAILDVLMLDEVDESIPDVLNGCRTDDLAVFERAILRLYQLGFVEFWKYIPGRTTLGHAGEWYRLGPTEVDGLPSIDRLVKRRRDGVWDWRHKDDKDAYEGIPSVLATVAPTAAGIRAYRGE
jgi:hypothetical protein